MGLHKSSKTTLISCTIPNDVIDRLRLLRKAHPEVVVSRMVTDGLVLILDSIDENPELIAAYGRTDSPCGCST
jgi:hypothetical protein